MDAVQRNWNRRISNHHRSLNFYFSGDEDTKEQEELAPESDQAQEEKLTSSAKSTSDTPIPEADTPTRPNIPLIKRIPSDAGAVLLIRINNLLEKGRKEMASLLPPDLPPMAGKALKDPTSLGLDVTEPIQIHVIPDAEKDVAPIWGIAGKISNREKFINTVELLAGLDEPIEKDGYHVFPKIDEQGTMALGVGPDFFILSASDNNKHEKNAPQIEAFMQADGSQCLLSSEKSFAKIHQQKDDLLVWFGGDKIYQAIDANLPETNFVMYNGGNGNLALNFEKGEMVLTMEFNAPSENMAYGRGKFSNEIISLTPADAFFTMAFAVKMKEMIEFTKKEILPEFEKEMDMMPDMEEAIPELGGMSINEAINAFTGELLISLSDLTMPDPGALGGLPMEENMDAIPFADPAMEEEPGALPFPSPEGTLGAPSANMDPTAMIMASMPTPEFIIAASIDQEKWLKLKAAPPLAMGLGLAMMQGISVTEKDDFLIIASKKHLSASQTGSVEKPVNGSDRELFQNNDFVWTIDIGQIFKMDLPIPPGELTDLIKEISQIEITSNNSSTSGTGSMNLRLQNTETNSLSYILKLVKVAQTMVPTTPKNLKGGKPGIEFQ